MTDAPNSVSEFGWRKPHPRRTPPWASLLPFFCRGAGSVPPRRGNVRFPCQFPLFPERFPHRVGADLCVRPDTPLRGTRHGPTHRSAPTDLIEIPINPRRAGGDRAPPLQGPKATNTQCWFEIYQAVVSLVFHKAGTRNDSRHQSIHLSSPVSAQRSVRARLPESPVTPGWFPKEGPRPFLWSFQGGLGGKYESHRSSSAPPAGCGHPALRDAPQGAAHSAFDRSQNPGCHPPAGGALRCLTPPDG